MMPRGLRIVAQLLICMTARHRFRRPMAISSEGACNAIAQTLRPEPLQAFPAWLIVGKNDDLPADLQPWIRDGGYRCFKLKLMGRDNLIDVQRTVDVFNAVRSLGVERPWLSIDSNEANPDAQSVLDYLHRLQAVSPPAFEALQYLEQPTARDIERHRFDWREVARLKPVLLDEGLTDATLFEDAKDQGWSGFAENLQGTQFHAHRRRVGTGTRAFDQPSRPDQPGICADPRRPLCRLPPHDQRRPTQQPPIHPRGQRALGGEVAGSFFAQRRPASDGSRKRDRPGHDKVIGRGVDPAMRPRRAGSCRCKLYRGDRI